MRHDGREYIVEGDKRRCEADSKETRLCSQDCNTRWLGRYGA
jgi:hypothetical protein